MNNSVTIAYRFEITLQLCFFDESKPKNNDELQPTLSNFFKNFDSNGGDDLCYHGGLDQSSYMVMGLKVRSVHPSGPEHPDSDSAKAEGSHQEVTHHRIYPQWVISSESLTLFSVSSVLNASACILFSGLADHSVRLKA
ncbi:hypothetical protein Tco_0502596 [Tanacetum coccineum]